MSLLRIRFCRGVMELLDKMNTRNLDSRWGVCSGLKCCEWPIPLDCCSSPSFHLVILTALLRFRPSSSVSQLRCPDHRYTSSLAHRKCILYTILELICIPISPAQNRQNTAQYKYTHEHDQHTKRKDICITNGIPLQWPHPIPTIGTGDPKGKEMLRGTP